MLKSKILKKLCILELIGVSLFAGCTQPTGANESKVVEIGITQIMEHPSLDKNREGFLKALEDNGYKVGENINIDYQNAQGDLPTSQTIANQFTSAKKDLIFAISTPSAQSAYNATKDIPILISAVTDPVVAGLTDSLEKSNRNISGTSDYIPVKHNLTLIKQLLPDAKVIGVIYNTSEINSKIQIDELKEVASKEGYTIEEVGITSTNEVNQAVISLMPKIDLLYTPTDNLVVSAMPILVQKAMEYKIPIITAEESSVAYGGLATSGIDYYQLGYQTGEMAVEILNGGDISTMPIEQIEEPTIVINEDTLNALSLEKPNLENVKYVQSESK